MHLLPRDLHNLDDAGAAVDLGQSPAEIVFLSFSDSELRLLARLYEQSGAALPTGGQSPLRLFRRLLLQMSHAFLHHSMSTASKYEPNLEEKGQHLVRAVQRSRAEGVIFASPSFCDPALLDRPMLQNVLKKAEIPYIAFKYAENSGQMQPIREQAGTFADSIKLWSGA